MHTVLQHQAKPHLRLRCCLLDLQMLAQASLEGLVFSTGGNVLHEVLLHSQEVRALQLGLWNCRAALQSGNAGYGWWWGYAASAICCLRVHMHISTWCWSTSMILRVCTQLRPYGSAARHPSSKLQHVIGDGRRKSSTQISST
jgi:hypothetical protein